jgi:hypothetical protein
MNKKLTLTLCVSAVACLALVAQTNTYTKVNSGTISVVETVPQEIVAAKVLPAKQFSYDFLLKQRDEIQKQWDAQVAQKQAEIVEINARQAKELAFVNKLIAEANKLGVTNAVEAALGGGK